MKWNVVDESKWIYCVKVLEDLSYLEFQNVKSNLWRYELVVNSWSSDCIIYLACGFINVVHVCQVGLGCHKCELSSDVIYDYKLHRFYGCEYE